MPYKVVFVPLSQAGGAQPRATGLRVPDNVEVPSALKKTEIAGVSEESNARILAGATGNAIGGMTGRSIGSTVGGVIGTLIEPGGGTAVGAVAGGFIGDVIGQFAGEKAGKTIVPK